MTDNPAPVNDDDKNHISVFEFFQRYPDEQSAIDFLEAERWPDRVICPHCKSDYTSPIKNRNRHSCNSCRRQFSVRTGSVFENSKIPLRKWIYAMYQFHTARKGVSAAQLSRELGITTASAWFMMHRLREAMDPGIEPLNGVIEVDEAFVGGLEKNKHSNKKLHKNWIEGKQIVLGMRERDDGRIVLRPMYTGKKATVVDEIRFTIQPGSTIYSDEGNSFASLELWYSHETVTHQRGEYVRELVTTNSIESVWAIVKRAHKGVYHQWSKKHGGRYLNEVAYRLTEGNIRIPIMARIRKLAHRSFEVQLTYRELVR